MHEQVDVIVRAMRAFMDAGSGQAYRPGDVVVGWDKERAERYAAAGLVEVVAVKPSKSVPAMSSAMPEMSTVALASTTFGVVDASRETTAGDQTQPLG